jgi:DNA-binding transcriptional regulator YhcF (GntR family)
MKQSVQKLSETGARVAALFALEQITPQDLEQLGQAEQSAFWEVAAKKVKQAKDVERDRLLEQLDLVVGAENKNRMWEHNHSLITEKIADHIDKHRTVPSATQLANHTGLSRTTIHKHLKGYAGHSLYQEQADQFRFMAHRVMASVLERALAGDMRAARLYLQAMGALGEAQPPANGPIGTQNNYIQINGQALTPELLARLTPEQLEAIGAVIGAALPEADSGPLV